MTTPKPTGEHDRPPFGEYRRLTCQRCGHVEREWGGGGGEFAPVDGDLDDVRALVDPENDR
jgi:hypothetical protein